MSETENRSVSDVKQTDQRTHGLNESSICGINELNEYVFIHIMSYLSINERIALLGVCLKWQSIIEKSFKSVLVLNRNTIFGQKKTFRSLSKLEFNAILEKCCNVRDIDMNEVIDNDPNFDVLETIAKHCERLETIDFGHFYFRWNQSFESLTQYLTQIKKMSSHFITENAINSIIDSQNIECIDISYNKVISKLDFNRFGPKIRELHLIGSDVTFDESVVTVLCGGNGVNLKNLSIDLKETKVLTIICSQMKELIVFEFNLYNKVNNDFNQMKELHHLRRLSIHIMNNNFESHDLTALMRALKRTHLLELQIIGLTFGYLELSNESLNQLSQNCQKLEKIVIRNAKCLTSAHMHYISTIMGLKHIDLMGCKAIGDGIQSVITGCPLLRSLNLRNCRKISGSTVDAFIDKSMANPKEYFSLNVMNTKVIYDFNREMPSNLKVVHKSVNCYYGCYHECDDSTDDDLIESDFQNLDFGFESLIDVFCNAFNII